MFSLDLKAAATKFFHGVENDSGRPDVMNACLSDVRNGGAIYYKDGKAKEFSKTSSRPQVVTLTAADGETIAKDLRDHIAQKMALWSNRNSAVARTRIGT